MKIVIAMATLAASVVVSTPAWAKSKECPTVTKQEIAALFDRWNQSLATKNPANVVANYAPHSVLLATLSNKPRLTVDEKMDYFKHFLMSHPSGQIDFSNIAVDCDTAVDNGLYTFTFGNGSKAQARYTFVYKWNGKDWLITTHHSSKTPESN